MLRIEIVKNKYLLSLLAFHLFLSALVKNVDLVSSFSLSVPNDYLNYPAKRTKRSINQKDETFKGQITILASFFNLHSTPYEVQQTSRREYMIKTFNIIAFTALSNIECRQASALTTPDSAGKNIQTLQNFQYSKEWIGTSLPLLSPAEASSFSQSYYDMGRWPDPILRRPASRISVSLLTNGVSQNIHINSIANKLRKTARQNKAVGLAAQQCGIDVSMIFLDDEKYIASEKSLKNKSQLSKTWNDKGGIFLVNPRIIARSSELEMQVWDEKCLVLPPSFTATVLRDSVIQVQYETLQGQTMTKILKGELARALQHELDHDRGILILDHVGLDELKAESEIMMNIEKNVHDQRQLLAYDRFIDESIEFYDDNNNKRLLSENSIFKSIKNPLRPPTAYAADDVKSTSSDKQHNENECDKECQEKRRKIIEDRRAMMRQSKSTGRAEVFELSKQRAALYGTTYKGIPSCPPNVPCI